MMMMMMDYESRGCVGDDVVDGVAIAIAIGSA